MTKRLFALLTALILALTAASAFAEDSEPDELLVTVNGHEIRENSPELRFWVNYLFSTAGSESATDYAQMYRNAMDYCIRYTLLEEEVSRQGKGMTEEEKAEAAAQARETWEAAVEEIMETEYGVSGETSEEERTAARGDAIAFIETAYAYTEESFTAEREVYFRLSSEMTRFSEIMAEGIEVTEEDVQEYYDNTVENDKAMIGGDVGAYEFYQTYYGYDFAYKPEGYRGISHILLEVDKELMNNWTDLAERFEAQNSEDGGETADGDEEAENAEPAEEPVTQEMVDAAKQAILDSVQEKLDEITAKLEAGADFEDLILEYGSDPGMEDEATRKGGYEVHAESILWDSEFQRTAMALARTGDISEPIVSSFGVHILKYLRDIPGGAEELTDEMKASLAESLRNDLINRKTAEWIGRALDEAEIVWTEAGEIWRIPETAADETAAVTEETEAAAEETEAGAAETAE